MLCCYCFTLPEQVFQTEKFSSIQICLVKYNLAYKNVVVDEPVQFCSIFSKKVLTKCDSSQFSDKLMQLLVSNISAQFLSMFKLFFQKQGRRTQLICI